MAVRRTARRHGLHTDASHRFERGADFNAAPVASAIVSSILLANGGFIEGDLVDVRVPALEARTAHRKPISLALSEVHRLLGTTVDKEGITAATVESVLTALGCTLASTGNAVWNITLPSWRLDLEREIDLIEEVARVYGYNGFANTLPAFGEGVQALPWAEAEVTVRRTLLAAGFHEAIASTFCSAADAALTAPQPGQVVPLGNPLSEEAGVMRPSLVPGMLAMIAGNLHRDVSDVRLFELGTVFSGSTEKVDERPALVFGAAGALPEQIRAPRRAPSTFTTSKGVVEQVLARFQIRTVYFDRFPPDAGLMPAWLHPYRSARVMADGITVGWFGQLHPSRGRRAQAQRYGAPRRTLSRPPLQAALAQARGARASRASSPCVATSLSSLTRALHGSGSIRHSRLSTYPSSSSGASAKSFATQNSARTSTPCSSASHFRHPIAPCATKSCSPSRLRSWTRPRRQALVCAANFALVIHTRCASSRARCRAWTLSNALASKPFGAARAPYFAGFMASCEQLPPHEFCRILARSAHARRYFDVPDAH